MEKKEYRVCRSSRGKIKHVVEGLFGSATPALCGFKPSDNPRMPASWVQKKPGAQVDCRKCARLAPRSIKINGAPPL